MSKVRQDAWLEENDELLAEAVIRHVTEGSTQLNAFEEAGDALNRTAAACGFRWNAVVRKAYEEQLAEAKKERKERMRVLGAPARRRSTNMFTINNSDTDSKSIPLSALSLDIVIAYLLRLQHSGEIGNESSKWRQLVHVTSEKNKKLEKTIAQLEEENRAIRKDYEQFVQIMNRARRLVTLDEEEERIAPVFKMEKNGNLVISGPTYQKENGDVLS
ncbi:RsfA family transcriptional regulator [Lysinibacillus sphaericus]|uniref:Prespore-specific transcriptional regulator RsfA n=2 Tax=Lysinibacillus TaxID=400634 RepID=A0A2S0K541_LYSSH|nr:MULTISPECIES: RsfA family transcriptional regulator [Lysinibacillus]AHN20450.1 transcriptional regulator [Lysinibacillus varians]AVK98495.1 RsfA family transcriptional regulator [Lysinibacillus sphaericus]MCS1381240.1 RsfA family transcriptional regulator [Lysinibacillus sphaericus]MED4544023.1 RsfA family transcriptional regulator [Lysinibacillus sphaericus]TKI17422.1 RsfA family transcriptional regulator [Lysinibacillus sphaericus]